ncbi:MAG: hypothetical protein HXX10_17545 [Rhodoplanes sp.]|uniref:hypothetical protein n=1 Tax=Rhodoplanes sp. TaxID=1968906 RepID=UPI001797E58B|nr:hypothetical protein [Rhodoplanes sp.]NVO15841.1 hypothetical protein [Rhodoplanes sp.]
MVSAGELRGTAREAPAAAAPGPTAPKPNEPIDPAAPRIDPLIKARLVEPDRPSPPIAPNITVGSRGWIHAGTYAHLFLSVGTWESQKLDFSYTASPSRLKGTVLSITSSDPLNLRAAPPDGRGSMGDILGEVQPSQRVRVLDVSGQKQVWLKVELLPSATARR